MCDLLIVRPKEGDAHPLGALPVGTEICCVQKYPNEPSTIAISAGTHCVLIRKVGGQCVVQLPSKHEISVDQQCTATIGRVSNSEHSSIPIGSPNRLRWLGFRPRSGLWHRKDGYCGRKVRPLPPVKVFNVRQATEEHKMQLTLAKL